MQGYNKSKIIINGGSIGDGLDALDYCQVEFTGGSIGDDLYAFHRSRVDIYEGSIGKHYFGVHASVTNIANCTIGGDIRASDIAIVDIFDGSIGNRIIANGEAEITFYGGDIGGDIFSGLSRNGDWDMNIITFAGTDFAVNGNPVNYGDLASDYAIPGTEPFWGDSCMTGVITGTLANGDTLNNTFYLVEYGDITFIAGPEPAIEVAVDIKPGSCPNPLNVNSKGVLPVAVLGTEDFDVKAIDVASIRLAGIGPARSSYEDVAAPVSDTNGCNCITDGPDGFLDLTLKFETKRIVEAVGDVNDGDQVQLELIGVLFDETPIEGADCILIRGRHKPINPADINKDGVVNAADFAIFTQNWLQSSIVDY
ncbi:MAG: hypothetical protein GWN00_33020 [Aliifodinibius sp.]|nr:hypothetical protein [Phycisphaerae bacterium]NIT60858.1 hypothetical protein [Fodinibius sp.]NIW39797.1 hypothetical protein [candidate division Zixibacteria bacterium]NIW98012.1 hypothetical protein [Phycisphaerae bacterium]NIY29439.1 hypothetical protein [Fodinibius sp.]